MEEAINQEERQYFPFYWRRFMDGIRGESVEFAGIYMQLLCRQAEKGRITDPVEKLARWMGGADPNRINEVLQAKFEKDETGYYNLVLEGILGTVETKIENKKSRAKNAAKMRWEKENGPQTDQQSENGKTQTTEKQDEPCTCNAQAMQTQCTCIANKSKLNKIKLNNYSVVVVVVPPPQHQEFLDFCISQKIEEPEIDRIWKYYQQSKNPKSDNPDAWRKKNGEPIENWKQHIVKVWLKNRKANVKSSTSKNTAGWRNTTRS